MEIRIGIQHTGKELVFETTLSVDEVTSAVTQAYSQNAATVSFSDVKGRQYLIPLNSLGYLECGTARERKAGFIN